jgi:hypothetical protein
MTPPPLIDLSDGRAFHPFGTRVFVHLIKPAGVTVTAVVEGRRHAALPWVPVAVLNETTPEPNCGAIIKAYPEMRGRLSRLSGGIASLVMIEPDHPGSGPACASLEQRR